MALDFELTGSKRTQIGKGNSRRIRRNNQIPAVVYGGNISEQLFTLDHNKISDIFRNEAIFSQVISLVIDGSKEKVVIKEIQRHPAKAKIQHIDFLRVRSDQKLTMHIPLHFIGEDKAPGSRKGGIFTHHLLDIEISCLPDALPEYLELDVSKMEIGDTLHLSDLKYSDNIEITALAHGEEDHNLPIISLQLPRSQQDDNESNADTLAEEVSSPNKTST